MVKLQRLLLSGAFFWILFKFFFTKFPASHQIPPYGSGISHFQAVAVCQALYAQLASIHSATENQFILQGGILQFYYKFSKKCTVIEQWDVFY
jgi:hypothetical protein